MTSVDDRSGRCSDRVVAQGPAATDNRAVGPHLAPESLTVAVRQPPERGRPQAEPSPGTGRGRGPGRNGQREQAERLQRRLSARDLAVLTSLDAHRFLTTQQIAAFQFQDHASPGAAARICRRTLQRLFELQVIEHLERLVGGVRAGSASYVWRVGPIGDQLLRLQAPHRTRARRKEPSLRHLEHCLAIADVHLSLIALARSGRVELLSVSTEPTCWRRYLSATGSVDTLKPDLFAITASGDYEDHWFIEIDRGTESLPTLLKKCAQYEDYRRTGSAQAEGGVFPLIVWVVPSEAHADSLAAAIIAGRNLDNCLYRVCTADRFPDVITGRPA
jgi:hypothetical protein